MVDKAPPNVQSRVCKVVNDFKQLTSDDRISAIEGVIDACEPAELKYLSDRLEIFLKRDFVRFLPNEVCMYLLSFLDPASLGRCCLVSKTWNEAVNACQPAWIRACKGIGWKVDASISSGSYWKKTYKRALTRLTQLKNGSAFNEGILLGHAARVYTLKFDENDLLASGSDDHTVRLWNVTTGECLRVIRTHTCANLAFDAYFLYTASFDNTISCWKWDSGDLIRSYRGHTGAVFSISYDEGHDLLVSGSADKTVRLWQLSTGEHVNMYHGHREWVTKVILGKSKVESLHHKPGDFVILSMDKCLIKIWLISNEVNCESLCELTAMDYVQKSRAIPMIPSYPTRMQSVEDPSDPNHCFLHPQLLFDGSRIMCSSDRGFLEWDFKDFTLTRVTPHYNNISYLLGAGRMMLLAADACENCLFIRMHGSALESQPQKYSSNSTNSHTSNGSNGPMDFLSASPDTMDYEQDSLNELFNVSGSSNMPTALPIFSPISLDPGAAAVATPLDESVDLELNGSQLLSQDDGLVNDINCNSIKPKSATQGSSSNSRAMNVSNSSHGNHATSDCPLDQGLLGKWKLPLCRWSKRGSNYVCGDQSWLNGFSDANHCGLVFAAALPDHSIYLLRWSDCT